MSQTSRFSALLGGVAVALLLGSAWTVSAQQCPPGTVQSELDVLQEKFGNLDPKALAADKIAEEPRKAPQDKQTSAPASAGTSTSLVNGASFPELFGLAVDQGLISSQNGATTVDLNLFGFQALARPEVLDRQSEYEKSQFLRRFGGALTLGGKGESFDRDGDGTADPALDSKSLGDNIVWEVRYRFKGSRDRRDQMNVDKLLNGKAGQLAVDFFTVSNTFHVAHLGEIFGMTDPASHCLDRKAVEAFLDRPEIAAEVKELMAGSIKAQTVYDQVAEEIDNSPVWTLVAGGTQRKDELGPNKRLAAIRGSLRSASINLEWSQTAGLRGLRDQKLLKGGLEYSHLFLQGSGITPALRKNGAELSLSGAYERYQDVPTAKHDTIAKLNVKMELPIIEGVKLPLSVTWANHKDLLDEKDEIRGNFAFAVDFSQLRKLGQNLLTPAAQP